MKRALMTTILIAIQGYVFIDFEFLN